MSVAAFVCRIEETQQGHGLPDEEEKPVQPFGIRTALLGAYQIGNAFYGATGSTINVRLPGSAAWQLGELGCMIWYGDSYSHTGRKKKVSIDIEDLVQK